MMKIYLLLVVFLMGVQEEMGKNSLSTKGPKSRGLLKNNPVAAVFNAVVSTAVTRKTAPCRWLRQTRRQYQLCRSEPGLQSVLNESRYVTVAHCEDQFRYDRWNCSHGRNMFRKVYRETAVMHALTAAGITTSVARACAEGKLKRCHCSSKEKQVSGKQNWRWGGCGDNLQYGRRFARKFLQLRNAEADVQESILRHNSEVGLRTVAAQMREVCKCHGVSGSCSVKTCWRRVAPFAITATVLKGKYHNAVKFDLGNRATKRAEPRNRKWPKGQLLYLEKSPTFCSVTAARQCLNKDNCATLCCGRGFTTRQYFESRNCNCRWKKNFQMICDQCSYEMAEYTCK